MDVTVAFLLAASLVLLHASEITAAGPLASRGRYQRQLDGHGGEVINFASAAGEDECAQFEFSVRAFADNVRSNFAACGQRVNFDSCDQVRFVNGKTGVYRTAGRDAWCDMRTDGGGWQVILRRGAGGRSSFQRTWSDYQNGFGSLDEDFWTGLDAMHEITTKTNLDLRVELRYSNGTELFALYHNFSVSGSSDNYRLTVGQYDASSTVEDSLSWHNEMPFTTVDRDNDAVNRLNCAQRETGGWWYRYCSLVNLTKDLKFDGNPATDYVGVFWNRRYDLDISYFSWVEMKVRPTEPQSSVEPED